MLKLVSTFAVLALGWLLMHAHFGAKSSSWLLFKAYDEGETRATAKIFTQATGACCFVWGYSARVTKDSLAAGIESHGSFH